MSDDTRSSRMEALLTEIRDYEVNGEITNEAIWRAFGRWTTQARMILGPPAPLGDAGYAINQCIDRPDEFSEEVERRRAEFFLRNADLNEQIRGMIETRLPEPFKVPDDYLKRTTGDNRAAIRLAYQNHGIDDRDNPC